MEPILAGLETEYGFQVEGRGAENQIDDAMALVRAYPGKRFVGWDYRHETPRADLRGFRLSRLAQDPNDAAFDLGHPHLPEQETRSDRVLPNGARFYNDHGHPEYATPECWSLDELVRHDLAGELAVQSAAREYERQSGRAVRIYKNNTDFHGASYGTHESYLVPRAFGFEALYEAVVPVLIARQVLCGAGKVGSESGGACEFQLSQRADFLVEPACAETLYRRSLFNTRDEPHADPAQWVRLHVISGDANMIPSATRRKVGLVKLALALMRADAAPSWSIPHPVQAFQAVSKDPDAEFRIELARGSWTSANEVLESLFSAAEKVLGVRPNPKQSPFAAELAQLIAECRGLLADLSQGYERIRASVDWAAKRWVLDRVRDSTPDPSRDQLRAYDLEYHRLDSDEGLYFGLLADGDVEPRPESAEVAARLERVFEPTRARARGCAVAQFADGLRSVGWRCLRLEVDGEVKEVDLDPAANYPEELEQTQDVERFIEMLRRR